MYITVKPLSIQCSYTEPMYDEHPDLASKTTQHTIIIPPYTGIQINKDGTIFDIDLPISLGISVHEGNISYQTNLKEEIGNSIQYISYSLYNKILNYQEFYEELKERLFLDEHSLECLQDEIHEILSSDLFLDEIKFQTLSDGLIKASEKYISTLSEIQSAKTAITNLLNTALQDQFKNHEIDDLDLE